MKSMIITDLRTMSTNSVWVIPMFIVLSVIVGLGSENAYMVPSMAMAMFTISYTISAPVSDTQNNWQLARIALPISRKEVVLGRYATGIIICLAGFAMAAVSSLLLYVIGSAMGITLDGTLNDPDLVYMQAASAILSCSVMLIMLAVIYPVTFAFDPKMALRVLPAIGVGIFVGFFAFVSQAGDTIPWLAELMEQSFMATSLTCFVFGLVLYLISIVPALKLYEKREL